VPVPSAPSDDRAWGGPLGDDAGYAQGRIVVTGKEHGVEGWAWRKTAGVQALVNVLDAPVGWPFYLLALGGSVGVMLWEYGFSCKAVVSGLLDGLSFLGLFCGIRGWLVGHWW
jgi:hypothetical protein